MEMEHVILDDIFEVNVCNFYLTLVIWFYFILFNFSSIYMMKVFIYNKRNNIWSLIIKYICWFIDQRSDIHI